MGGGGGGWGGGGGGDGGHGGGGGSGDGEGTTISKILQFCVGSPQSMGGKSTESAPQHTGLLFLYVEKVVHPCGARPRSLLASQSSTAISSVEVPLRVPCMSAKQNHPGLMTRAVTPSAAQLRGGGKGGGGGGDGWAGGGDAAATVEGGGLSAKRAQSVDATRPPKLRSATTATLTSRHWKQHGILRMALGGAPMGGSGPMWGGTPGPSIAALPIYRLVLPGGVNGAVR